MVLVFSGGRPTTIALPMHAEAMDIGSEQAAFSTDPAYHASPRRLIVRRNGSRFTVTDLCGCNDAAVDGEALPPGAIRDMSRVIRTGSTLLIPVRDVGPIKELGVTSSAGTVAGPALQRVLNAIAHTARSGNTVHLAGESGTGKEHLARAFHASERAGARFQSINCALIPATMADRLLFGDRDGMTEGYVQAARGGTLFIEDVAALPPPVQAKLLYLIERGEVVAVGASRPNSIELRICFSTRHDLRAEVAAGRLREDLYHRISTPCVVPPLRDRLEELPWLLRAQVQRFAPELSMHVSFAEACLLQFWAGNVAELLAEARVAAQAAIEEGSARVESRHLRSPVPAAPSAARSRVTTKKRLSRDAIVTALEHCGGNISAASRELGVHRTQLRRWVDKHRINLDTTRRR